MGEVYVVGAGGHARVVVGLLEAAGRSVAGLFDDDPARAGTEVLGVPVLGPALAFAGEGAEAVLAIGGNAARRAVADRLAGRFRWATVVHPVAWVHRSVRLGEGTVVFAGAVVQPEARLGAHVVVNTAASVDHECVVGDLAQIAPGARLAGNVHVDEGAFVGIGASVVQGRRIGAWSTVGAGAVVVRDVPPGVTVVGVPARARS